MPSTKALLESTGFTTHHLGRHHPAHVLGMNKHQHQPTGLESLVGLFLTTLAVTLISGWPACYSVITNPGFGAWVSYLIRLSSKWVQERAAKCGEDYLILLFEALELLEMPTMAVFDTCPWNLVLALAAVLLPMLLQWVLEGLHEVLQPPLIACAQ